MKVSFPDPPRRLGSALTYVEQARLGFPFPRRANSGLRHSALRVRGKGRMPGAKFAPAGFRLIAGPGRLVDCPFDCRSIPWSSSSKGIKRGGVFRECGAFYEGRVVGSSIFTKRPKKALRYPRPPFSLSASRIPTYVPTKPGRSTPINIFNATVAP